VLFHQRKEFDLLKVIKRLFPLLAVAVALGATSTASADWRNYFGPNGTMYTDPTKAIGASGTNYWTNNRVWRPVGYNFYLGYDNDSGYHYSTDNYSNNPFYWPAYGYSTLLCVWHYNGSYPSVYPVTCQGYV
jgi:hypothetical protein